MRELCYIAAVGLLLGMAFPAAADEGYDPMLFSSEEEANNNLFSIMPPTPPKINPVKTAPQNPLPVSPQSSARQPQPAEAAAAVNPLPEMTPEDLGFPDDEETTGKEIPETASQQPMPKQETALPSPTPARPQPQVDPSRGLTDNFKTDATTAEDAISSKVKDTWIGKITETAAEKVKETSEEIKTDEHKEGASLEGLIKSSKNARKRANASVFDISGVMLRMTLPQAEAAMKQRHFTKVSVKYEIPNFIKWRNEEKCRNNGVVGYERLASCVVELAKKDHHQYPETVRFSRFDTKEELEIKLTSNFTNNKVHRILYKSLSPAITGNSNKAVYLRNVKIYDFWKKVNQKYGTPDNKDEVLWGLGGNKPYLKAASGVLLLEDPMLRELDYTRMSREDQRFINTDLYNF